MSKIYVLYNHLAGNSTCEEQSRKINDIFEEDELFYRDLCDYDADSLNQFISGLEDDEKIIISGGDGTLSFFVNAVDTDIITNEILYFPAGSGNDFYHDVDPDRLVTAIPLNKYIKDLPYVEVKGIKRKFINGIGFGIDGYCCEEGDKVRNKCSGKPVNYSVIALKGLLYDFERVNAKITIDGVTYDYQDVWMAPSMNGRYYGGGMMCAPNQDRLDRNNKLSVIVVHTPSRIKLLKAFSSVYKGEHLKYKNLVTELKGKNIKVEFDKPTALQIDGDTVTAVTEYCAYIP